MGQLRTGNKRHNRAILAAQASDKAAGSKLPTPSEPTKETVQS
ncbi:MAG: hypothetical protein JWM38_1562 [Sphingomonas bacterium]|jgi:hypothetical protein|nr:hypothetical protein [Sphingomonas bacterium]MDB5718135.1 hypothetical protein [Sphingomonas bacterium]